MTITFTVDDENNADLFWDSLDAAARTDGRPEVTSFARDIRRRGVVKGSVAVWDFVQTVPGWEDGPKHAPTALLVEGVGV